MAGCGLAEREGKRTREWKGESEKGRGRLASSSATLSNASATRRRRHFATSLKQLRTMATRSAASALSLVAALAALLSVASSSAASFARGRAYANCQQLDRKANINIAWSVDGANVHVALWAPAVNGYFAVGLSEDGWMGGGTKGFSEVWVVRERVRLTRAREGSRDARERQIKAG